MDLRVEKREILGKKTAALRAQGLIPAELYGRGVANVHVAVATRDFQNVFRSAGENTVVHVVLDNKKIPALIASVTRHPVSDEIESVDLYQVRLDEKIRTKVPLEFIGESPAIKEKRGILVKAMHEIELEALPNDIPHSLTVYLQQIVDVNQSVYVRDLEVPKHVKLFIEPESVVATVKPQMTEEEEKALEAQAVPSVEQVVVETEEKKAVRQTKEAAAVPAPANAAGKEGPAPVTPKK